MPQLMQRTLMVLVTAVIVVTLCYFFIDKPMAFWVYQHHLAQYAFFRYFTYIPTLIIAIIPLIYVFFVIRFCYRANKSYDYILLTLANSVLIAAALKNSLKWVFGRYWPQTWTNHNPSLIHDNAYGFHFFHYGSAYESFPSGHTTIIVTVLTVLWLTCPRWRWLGLLAALLVITGLVAMNYHFVGDVAGGAALGYVTGFWVVNVSRLREVNTKK
jgi:membrane-associated phospholipid phosphatase